MVARWTDRFGLCTEGRQNMATVLRMMVLILVAALLVGGCSRSSSSQKLDKEIEQTGISGQKADLQKAIDRKFENTEAHYELAKLYSSDGLFDKAEWHYNIAIGFEPAHHRAQAGLVKLLADSGKAERSKLTAEMYMNQARVSAKSSYLLGQAFQKELLDEYAISCYQQAMTLAPDSAAVHKRIGLYYLSKNDKVRAEEYFRRSFQIDPYQPDISGQLGRMGVEVAVPRKSKQSGEKIDKLAKKEKTE
jgi:Tfp pilus assembly protein PilF